MNDAAWPKVEFPKFDPDRYLDEYRDAQEAVYSGAVASAFDHFVEVGIDGDRRPSLRRDPLPIRGGVERFYVSESGYFLIVGWLADEGVKDAGFRLVGADFSVDLPSDGVLRHARLDVEKEVREGAYDYGMILFGRTPSRSLLKRALLFQVSSSCGAFQTRVVPELVADKRLLDTVLIVVTTVESHAGKEANIYGFLASFAGDRLVDLFRSNVATGVDGHYVERFGSRPVTRSFITVLFGTTEPILLQPVLFRQSGVDFGEWIYVCNSPEDAGNALRLGRLISDLYDVMITVIVMTDNVGFGMANNLAVQHASSDAIYVINPDVYPIPAYAQLLTQSLEQRALGRLLWGGLLFYDDANVMHSGMFVDRDNFFRCHAMNGLVGRKPSERTGLLRVEHFEKGVPLDEARWQAPMVVPAITGALMAFARPLFERLGGFSTRYIFGHYEDADLSLRWAAENGPVAIDPLLRLVHLEGQGSTARGLQFRGAALINRYLFTLQHAERFDSHVREFTTMSKLENVP